MESEMITWPVAVVICMATLAAYGLLDTWLKRPYFEKRVGSMVIKMRGEEARVAMEHHNSMTVMGFGETIDELSAEDAMEDAYRRIQRGEDDEASGDERANRDARTYPELDDETGRADTKLSTRGRR